MESSMHLPVALTHCTHYAPNESGDVLRDAVFAALEASGFRPARGDRVLVKPNLLRADALTCTHPRVTTAVCSWLLDNDAKITVADSPGFGTVEGIARHIGLTELLLPLGLHVRPFKGVTAIALADGGSWGVARQALECDSIVSVPRVKAHVQMRLTLAVKNLFGCVVGLRKPLAHTIQGHRGGFPAAIADLLAALPPVAAVVDGVTAMDTKGPSGGRPFPLGCIGASANAAALDTALYEVLGVRPEQVPLWAVLQQRHVPGSHFEDLALPLEKANAFNAVGFRLPDPLMDISFRPLRLAQSLCRRVWISMRR